MRPRAGLVALALPVLALAVWRASLFHVERADAVPVPLRLIAPARRAAVAFDVPLPLVPAGEQRLAPGGEVLLVHYWAPWERHSGPQAQALDSLRRLLPAGSVRVAVVCLDPYPSVTRYVAHLGLRLPVLIDVRRELSGRLACPVMPYTYVFDRAGRIAVAQEGEVDWLAPATRAALARLGAEPVPPPPPPAGTAS